MRVLFVSGTTGGGSGRSQRELARQLILRKHDVLFLVNDKRPAPVTRWMYGHLSDVSVRVDRTVLAPMVLWGRDRLARGVSKEVRDDVPHWVTPLPQNALRSTVRQFKPDVVVVNSVERWAWRIIHAVCRQLEVPDILYIREENSLLHLDTGVVPDVLVANTPSLAKNLEEKGRECSFVPSVVDTTVTHTESSRRVAMAINPIPEKGGDIVLDVARELPHVPFLLQESWPLVGDALARVEAETESLSNVHFRRSLPPGPELYSSARVLLVPYRVNSRPRVVLEAQANGIPVIAGDTPALREAVGEGGLVVPLEDIEAWAHAVQRLWEDEELYRRCSVAAVKHSRRPEVEPSSVTERFESLMTRAVSGPLES